MHTTVLYCTTQWCNALYCTVLLGTKHHSQQLYILKKAGHLAAKRPIFPSGVARDHNRAKYRELNIALAIAEQTVR